MKIRTGLLFLMAGALIGLSTASSYAVPTLLDGAQSAQADASGASVAMTGEEWSPSIQTAIPDVRLHSGHPNGAFLVAGTAAQPAAEPLLEPFAGDGTIVVFNDQFNDVIPENWRPRKGKWDIVQNSAGENDYLASHGRKAISTSIIYHESFSDFVFTVKMSRRSSDNERPSRIIVRVRGPMIESGEFEGHFENAYEFNIARNGTFAVFKFVNGTDIKLQDWTRTDAIKRGSQWNELRVAAKGPKLSFRINGVRVWHERDTSIKSGMVGIGLYRHPDSTDNELLVDWAILETFVDESSQTVDGLAETSMDPNVDQLQLDGGNADGPP